MLQELRECTLGPELAAAAVHTDEGRVHHGFRFPCPDCGVYFSSLRHMHSHRAVKHGYKGQNARPRAGVLAASLYAQGSAAGMPQCAACGQIFTRVEGLKKHLNSGCIAKPQTPSTDTGTATAEEAQVPSQRAESPRGRTLQAVPETMPLQPRFEDPAFQSAVLKDWRLAALDPLHSKHLSEHCVFCGQWGSRLKQHLRLMHASCWRMKAVAESMCQSAGLSATSPCSYCSIRVQQPRRHVLSCIVPFQVALAKLAIAEGQYGRRPDGGESVGSGPAGAGDGLQRAPIRGQEREGEGKRGCSGAGRRETSQVATGREQGQRSILQFLGKLESGKAPLERAAAIQGEFQGGGSSDTRAASLLGEDVGSARAGTHEDPPRRGVHSLLRYFRPRMHGHASGGGSIVVGSVFPGQGEHGSEDDARYVDDERHEGTSGECPSRGGPAAALLHGRMAEGGSYGIGSCVGLSHLECQGEETRSGIHPSTEALGCLEAPGRPSRAPAAGWSGHEVQYHQAPGPHERVQDGGRSDDATAQPERGLGSAMLRCNEGPQRECGDEVAGRSLAPRTGAEASIGEGSGGSIPRHVFLRLGAEGSVLGSPVGPGRPPDGAAQQGALLRARPGLKPFPAKLRNHSNLCYANSVFQALSWLMELTGTAVGRLKVGLGILRSSQHIHLPECFALRWLFQTWPSLHQQHDAGEFLAHCLRNAQAEAWAGTWQARLSNPDRCTDEGTLLLAVPLPISGSTLQSLIDSWHVQYSRHAVAKHKGILFLQLERYSPALAKNLSEIRIRPGDQLAVPVFAETTGLSTLHESFQVAVIIYHLGNSVTSGHYLTLIGLPQPDQSWRYLVCDDNKCPRQARAADLRLVDNNAYLIGLVRSQ